MRYTYCKTHRIACRYARMLERAGYQTAVLISGEVRYWKG